MTPYAHDSFGDVIRQRRNELGISLRKFAEQVGVSPSYISFVERGESDPPGEETICKMAGVLNLDTDMLLGMANKISSDVKDTITKRPEIMASFLRTLDGKSDEELKKILKKLDKGN